MYYTVLERFSVAELLSQTAALSNLEKELLVDKKAKSRRRTLRNQKDRIAARIQEIEIEGKNVHDNCTSGCTTNQTTDGTTELIRGESISHMESVCLTRGGALDDNGDDPNRHILSSSSLSPSSSSPSPSSSSHRPIIAPVTLPILTSASPLHPSTSMSSTPCAPTSPSLFTPELLGRECVLTDQTSTYTVTNPCIDTNEENTQNLRPKISSNTDSDPYSSSIPSLINVPSLNNVPSNPKIRLGWGFWQS